MKRFIFLCLSLMVALPVVAADNQIEVLGSFDDWSAFSYKDEAGLVCYMATEPTKSQGKYSRRDDVFLIITHRPNDKTYDVVNVVAGYTYRPASKPTMTIDNNKSVNLVVHNNTAWGKDEKVDEDLVNQMKKGSRALLKGTSARGTLTTDTFSLKGFSKAYQLINKACGRE